MSKAWNKQAKQAMPGVTQCARCGSSIKEPHYGDTTEEGDPLCISCAAKPDYCRTIGSKLKEKRPGSTPFSRATPTVVQQDIVELAQRAPFLTVSQAVEELDVSDVYIRKTLREYHKSH
jgi:hypothetical protein